MTQVTVFLLQEFGACLAMTFYDEIVLLFKQRHHNDVHLFNGDVLQLCTATASKALVCRFYVSMLSYGCVLFFIFLGLFWFQKRRCATI